MERSVNKLLRVVLDLVYDEVKNNGELFHFLILAVYDPKMKINKNVLVWLVRLDNLLPSLTALTSKY